MSPLMVSEEVRTQLITHDRTIGFHDVRLAELDLRVQCAETTNYDGILIWKIIEYKRRKREAIAGTVPISSTKSSSIIIIVIIWRFIVRLLHSRP